MADLDNCHRLTAVVRTVDDEIATFRITTGARITANWDDIADAYKDFVVNMQSQSAVSNILGESDLETITVDQWIAAQSKFVQVQSFLYTGLTRNTDTLPLQCSTVVTLRYLSPPPGEPLQRYRNRFYVGPMSDAAIAPTGKLHLAFRDDLADQVEALDTALAAIALDGSAPAGQPPGLGVTSPTGGFIFQADQIEVGNVVDTQRRRRNGLVEVRSVRNITA